MSVKKINRTIRNLLNNDEQIDLESVRDLIDVAEKGHAGVTKKEEHRLAKFLQEHGNKFETDAKKELQNFLTYEMKTLSPAERKRETGLSVPMMLEFARELHRARNDPFYKVEGTLPPAEAKAIRDSVAPLQSRGTVGLTKVAPSASLQEIDRAMQRSVTAIDGFSFLDEVPEGKDENHHTVLIKPGVNWGINGYPTVSSWESVYSMTKMSFQEATKRGAEVDVIVGDESGIEIKQFGGTTMQNLERTGILHGAVLAGLERAAQLETQAISMNRPPGKFKGAGEMYEKALEMGKQKPRRTRRGKPRRNQFINQKNHKEMIRMAENAGVKVMAFDEVQQVRVPVPDTDLFPNGILMPKIVHEEVTDIINLPKPPGRHMLLGCTGLTGAVKNFVGLMGGSDRSPGLHGQTARFPGLNDGKEGSSLSDRNRSAKRNGESLKHADARYLRRAADYPSDKDAANFLFLEKIAGIHAAFAPKVRFSATDMRKTLSSGGPDRGTVTDIGSVIATKDANTMDVIASALLKATYNDIEKPKHPLLNRAAMREYQAGQDFLSDASPLDGALYLATLATGIGPISADRIDFLDPENSGYSQKEYHELQTILSTPRTDSSS